MPCLQNTLRGIKCILGLSRCNCLPIILFILESIFKLLAPNRSLNIDTVILWAAFSLAFFGFLRCSELTCNGQFDHNVHPTCEDIAFFPNITSAQHMTVCIKKSRTDPFRQSSTITITSSQSNVCAVAATRGFLLQTPNSFPQSTMFQFKDGTPLSQHTLASNLHTLLDLCGLQSNNYNTHSFRIGAAMTAATASLNQLGKNCIINVTSEYIALKVLQNVPEKLGIVKNNKTLMHYLIIINRILEIQYQPATLI